MSLHRAKLNICLTTAFLSLCLGATAFGVAETATLVNKTPVTVDGHFISYDANQKPQMQTFTLAPNQTTPLNTENCPDSSIYCKLVVNSEKSPYPKGTRIIFNKDTNKMLEIKIPTNKNGSIAIEEK